MNNLILSPVSILLFTVFISANASTVQWPPPEPVKQRLSEAIDLVDSIQAELPPPVNNAESLAGHLEYDFKAAISYVRDQVRFEPYRGVMRGPDGTAVTARGNAWDQAALLASLLNTMGADAQIVVGSLSHSDIRRLLAQAFRDIPDEQDFVIDPQKLIHLTAEYNPEFSKVVQKKMVAWESEVDAASDSLNKSVAEISRRLQTLLDEGGVDLSAEKDPSKLIQSFSEDYAWVRWRMGPSGDWVEVHPVFAEGDEPKPEPKKYLADEIPPQHQHRVALRLWIERTTGSDSEAERIPIMDEFERPTAQLFKDQLGLGMGPLNAGSDSSQSFLVPLLNDSIAPGGLAVTAQGMTVNAEDAGTNAAEFFATVSSRLGTALEGLIEATNGESGGPRLTAVVLTVEITAPGLEPETVERRLVDLRHTGHDNFPAAAAFQMVLDIDIGAQNSLLTMYKMVKQQRALVQAIPVLYAIARGAITVEEAQNIPELRELDHSLWLDFEVLSSAFLSGSDAQSTVFRPGPLLASRRTFVDQDRGLLSISDILFNPVTAFALDDHGEVRVDPSLAISQGVRDTVLESYLMPSARGWSQRMPETLILDKEALGRSEKVSGWPEAAQEMAMKDLSDGYVLAVAKDPEPHWWRVDPKTGETLGMGELGGVEATEYVIAVTVAAISTWMFKNSVESCDEQYADNQKMADCCIVGNLIVTYGTGAMGGVVNLPSLPAAAFVKYPWVTALGYIFAGVSFETSYSATIGAGSQLPIASICASITEQ